MSDRSQLVEAIAVTMAWAKLTPGDRSYLRAQAEVMADYLLRQGNTGNAIHLKKALEEVVRRREGVA